ncbi:small ribosomal subunit protein mS29 isoform X2 [Ambystoma mexicanum]|uniref:small ribosomal subunit protein mS29 isoform X2 n=1 Tax=Ambystoma mexicanum TaxID=8296 RepID=UPI0037E93D9F
MFRSPKRWMQIYQKHESKEILPGIARAWITNAAAVLHIEASSETPRAIFRTNEADPAKHAGEHIGQHYRIPAEEMKSVFPQGLPPRFQKQVKTFNEACLMVRRPALEIISCIKSTHFSHPTVRYVIYGQRGTGKSLTLCHIVHYCARQDWLLVHIPDAHILVKNCKEIMQSSYHKDRLDQPLEASTWLKSFKTINERFLKQILTQQKYIWSKRESTEEGRPLGEVVDQGLTRVKSASDVVGVVLKELKRQAPLGSYRMLVAVDSVNALWGKTSLKKEDKSMVAPDELTLVHNLRKMVHNDWSGGAIVMTVTKTGSVFMPRSAYLPHELLGKFLKEMQIRDVWLFGTEVRKSIKELQTVQRNAEGTGI